MMVVWAQEQREKTMKWIRGIFLNTEGVFEVDKAKLIGEICQTKGCTLRKAQEYINELLFTKFIYENEHGLWLSKELRAEIKPAVEVSDVQ